MKKHKLLPYAILLFLFAILSFSWVWYGRSRQEISENMKLPVVVIKARKGYLKKSLELTGFAESENQVTVLPKISGTLDSLLVDVGDQVTAGQIIAKIDPELYRLTLNQIEAMYRVSEWTYNRVSRIYESGAGSGEQYENAKAQYESLQAQYDLALLQYEYTNVISPVDGTILIKHINQGSIVAPQVPIVTIGSLDQLAVSVSVPEEYYRYFSEKSSMPEVTLRQPSALENEEIPGRIDSAAPYISPESRNFEVKVQIPSPRDIRPGMLLYISFALESLDESWYLPAETLKNGESLWYVDALGAARSLQVEPDFYDGDLFPVPPEWMPLDFIIQGQHFLSDGQPVTVNGEISP